MPATYQWVDQPYLMQPARNHRVYHPPVYETVSERVLVQRGTTTYHPVAPVHVEPAPCGGSCGTVVAPTCGGSSCGAPAAMPVYHPFK